MAVKHNSEINAGVHANIGMDFQKNCTIYLFLEKYDDLKNQKYFIVLEHLEDIVFGFLENDTELSKIETYQAKKSSKKWTTGNILEIIKKIAETSQSILDDTLPKTSTFNQENYFATNHTIELKSTIKKKDYVCTVNESNEAYEYKNLNQNIKDKLLKGNKNVIFDSENKANFETLNFRFIDLGRTYKSQLDQLNGMFTSVFGDSITDHKAALHTFYYALKKIENRLNQGNSAKLSDNKKRIESYEIQNILNILTTKKLAFDFWRDKGEEIRQELNINIFDATIFELHYENSFDKFKDINESEHQKIFDFVENNKQIFKKHSLDKDCMSDFINSFNKEKSSTLSSLQLKATIVAAYIEIKNTL
ncbi:hypothetical protein [Cellulophaga baltica]|uniref:hypothetical protein n=1 Tax=Cellulophaga baltica TaxID=76594 RepID=UPI0021485AA7|nr:hypothetical protein [Cellulophaga baltica]MCR1027002.1 hypothetical protein [Cellulophaga baltica]